MENKVLSSFDGFMFNEVYIPSLCLTNKILENEERVWLKEAYRVNASTDPDRAVHCALSCPHSLENLPFFYFFASHVTNTVEHYAQQHSEWLQGHRKRYANLCRLKEIINNIRAQNDPRKNTFTPARQFFVGIRFYPRNFCIPSHQKGIPSFLGTIISEYLKII